MHGGRDLQAETVKCLGGCRSQKNEGVTCDEKEKRETVDRYLLSELPSCQLQPEDSCRVAYLLVLRWWLVKLVDTTQ